MNYISTLRERLVYANPVLKHNPRQWFSSLTGVGLCFMGLLFAVQPVMQHFFDQSASV